MELTKLQKKQLSALERFFSAHTWPLPPFLLSLLFREQTQAGALKRVIFINRLSPHRNWESTVTEDTNKLKTSGKKKQLQGWIQSVVKETSRNCRLVFEFSGGFHRGTHTTLPLKAVA